MSGNIGDPISRRDDTATRCKTLSYCTGSSTWLGSVFPQITTLSWVAFLPTTLEANPLPWRLGLVAASESAGDEIFQETADEKYS
jgi:hypothetical protein